MIAKQHSHPLAQMGMVPSGMGCADQGMGIDLLSSVEDWWHDTTSGAKDTIIDVVGEDAYNELVDQAESEIDKATQQATQDALISAGVIKPPTTSGPAAGVINQIEQVMPTQVNQAVAKIPGGWLTVIGVIGVGGFVWVMRK